MDNPLPKCPLLFEEIGSEKAQNQRICLSKSDKSRRGSKNKRGRGGAAVVAEGSVETEE